MPEENENLDLFDEVEEVVSRDGKKVKRRGIFLLPNLLTTTSLFFALFLPYKEISYQRVWPYSRQESLMA